jgi:peptidyl-prolyl cis-trans isomerase B (cyclophilin B)
MKKIINPTAIFYIIILIIITVLIILATGSKSDINQEGDLLKINNKNIMNNTKNISIETNFGTIGLELYPDKAPKTVANFIKLSNSNFYDDTKFHRVIKGFMIQGGDPYTKGEDTSVYGTGGPGYKFADEPNDLPMIRGMIAMANSGPNTNGSQFFIITAVETPWLNGKHTVFGKVISGMEVVDKIENSAVNQNDLPLTPVIINKIIVK